MSAPFLLVHGACHGAWCWDRVIPLLAAASHKAIAPDLPGRSGIAKAGWRLTLKDYAETVVNAARQQPGPVVAVGHSMGGLVIAAAAEMAPELFERLIYLSAFMPASGDSLASLAGLDKESDLSGAAQVSWLKGTVSVEPASFGPVYCTDCTAEDVAWAQERLVPESVRPSTHKVILSAERYQTVPRSYIRCTKDRALSLVMQDLMIARQPCEHILTLEASHSPFLSMPDQLASALLSIVR